MIKRSINKIDIVSTTMNKNIDNINSTEESVKKALDIMECSTEISDRQLQEILEDEEGLQACRDIMDSSLFLQHKRGIELPDVEIELGRFKQKHHTVKMQVYPMENRDWDCCHDCHYIRSLLFHQ